MSKFFSLLTFLALQFTFSSIFAQVSGTATVPVGGTMREYRYHLPPGFSPGNPAPLIINMHGYGSTAAQQEFYSGMNAVADTAGFVVCYPEGLNNAWNVGFTGAYHAGVDDVGFISALIDVMEFQYFVDPTRIYVCGMSNGGFMSYRLACELSGRIAAFASVTGCMTDSIDFYCTPNRPIPAFHIHGTADQTVPFNGVPGFHYSAPNSIQHWVTENNCTTPVLDTFPNTVLADSSYVTAQYWPACDQGSEVLFYKIENGGHTWPGAISIPGLGNTNQDINASREIWEFFLNFDNPNPVISISPSLNANIPATVAPNPSNGIIRIEWPDHTAKGQMFGTDGRILREFDMESTCVLESIPTGMYFIQLRSDTESQMLRIVVAQ